MYQPAYMHLIQLLFHFLVYLAAPPKISTHTIAKPYNSQVAIHQLPNYYMALVFLCQYSFLFLLLNYSKIVTVHSVLSNTLRDAGNMNLLVQCPRSIVCFANLIYVNRINSRGISQVFCCQASVRSCQWQVLQVTFAHKKHLAGYYQ